MTEDKIKCIARKANNQAYTMLLLAVEYEDTFSAVDGAKLEHLPENDACMALLALV
jgi:hypothetical protein